MGLFEMENDYIRKGYSGKRLSTALNKDSAYQKLLKKKQAKISTLLKTVYSKDLRNYVLSEKEDFIILDLAHKLERKKLSISDKEIVHLIKAQLEHDWRKSIIQKLKNLLKKYSE